MERQLMLLAFDKSACDPTFAQGVAAELFYNNKRLVIDVDTVTRDPYEAYIVVDSLQHNLSHVDLDTGLVTCSSFFQYYETLLVAYMALDKKHECDMIRRVISMLEHNSFIITGLARLKI